jgi:hypothetical protein
MQELVQWLRERVRDLQARDLTNRSRFRPPSLPYLDLHAVVGLRNSGVDRPQHRVQQSLIRYAE